MLLNVQYSRQVYIVHSTLIWLTSSASSRISCCNRWYFCCGVSLTALPAPSYKNIKPYTIGRFTQLMDRGANYAIGSSPMFLLTDGTTATDSCPKMSTTARGGREGREVPKTQQRGRKVIASN